MTEELIDIRTTIENDKYSNHSYSKISKRKTAAKTTAGRITIGHTAAATVYKRDLNLTHCRKIANLN